MTKKQIFVTLDPETESELETLQKEQFPNMTRAKLAELLIRHGLTGWDGEQKKETHIPR